MALIMVRTFTNVYAEGAKMTESQNKSDSPPLAALTPPAAEEPPQSTTLLQVAAERHADLLKLLTHSQQQTVLDPDWVHDARVATRRLEEVAAILNALLEKAAAKMVQETLKRLRKAAGELRDLDVTCHHLSAGGKWKMPAVLHHIAEELTAELHHQRPDLEKKLREEASSVSVTGAMVLLARVIEDAATPGKSAPAEEKLRRTVEKRLASREKQMRKSFGNAAKKQTAEALHKARIAAKKLRYVTELADAGALAHKKKELKILKAIQQLLGDHHDVHVIEQTLDARVQAQSRTIAGLAETWRKWRREKEHEQAQRAGDFFVKSYSWMNA